MKSGLFGHLLLIPRCLWGAGQELAEDSGILRFPGHPQPLSPNFEGPKNSQNTHETLPSQPQNTAKEQ